MHVVCPHCHGAIEFANVTADEEITCPACGSSFHLAGTSTTAEQPATGKRIGKFVVLAEVGKGGCGTVYKARDPELDRVVAVKVPRAGNLSGPQDVERFLREARSAAQLSHPAIVLLDAGNLDDYRQTCATVADLAGDLKDETLTRQLTATCVLAPEPLKDLQPLLDAFKKSMSDQHPEDLRIYGSLLLRAAKPEEAVTHLEAARKLRDDTVYEDLLLALAYHQLQKPDEARACLDRGIYFLDRKPAANAAFNLQASYLSPLHVAIATQLSMFPDNYERVVGWQGWIELQVLRREAVKALEK